MCVRAENPDAYMFSFYKQVYLPPFGAKINRLNSANMIEGGENFPDEQQQTAVTHITDALQAQEKLSWLMSQREEDFSETGKCSLLYDKKKKEMALSVVSN